MITLNLYCKAFYQVSGVAGGPVVAVYSMGMFTRFANKKVLALTFFTFPSASRDAELVGEKFRRGQARTVPIFSVLASKFAKWKISVIIVGL